MVIFEIITLSAMLAVSGYTYTGCDPDNPSSFKTSAGGQNIYRLEDNDVEENNFIINTAYCKPYEIEALSSFNFGILYNGKASLGLDYSYFGVDYYNESKLSLVLGFFRYKYFLSEIRPSLFMTNYDFDSSSNSIFYGDIDLSIVSRISKYFDLNFYAQELLNYAEYFDELENLYYSAGLNIYPANGLCLKYSYTSIYGDGVNVVQIDSNIFRNLTLKSGYIFETESSFISSSVIFGNYKFKYCFKNHNYLGNTHVFGFSYSFKDYKVTPLRNTKKKTGNEINEKDYIDYLKCSQEDLKRNLSIDEKLASRIIKYRDLNGAITKKGLRSIGLNKGQINELESYSLYEIPEKERPFKKRKKRINKRKTKKKYLKCPDSSKRQLLIKELIKKGLSPKVSLKVSQKSAYMQLEKLYKYIDSLSEIDNVQKKDAKVICASYYSY